MPCSFPVRRPALRDNAPGQRRFWPGLFRRRGCVWAFQHDAEKGADARGACADDEDGVILGDFGDSGGPEAGGQHIAHEKRLLIGDRVGDLVQALIRIGYPYELSLSTVDTASQRPAAVGVGAVIHEAVLAEETLAAEGLHIHRHPVAGLHCGHSAAHRFHHTHHLMAHGDTGNRPGHRAMLDVQVAGADAAQSHPHNCIPGILNFRLGLFR